VLYEREAGNDMLRTLDGMLGSSIVATDGEIGKVYNVFFDDRSWSVRYLVVETGSWLTRRKILITPAALGRPLWAEKTIPVLLTKEQVQNCPDVDADRPVSRQQEPGLTRHYGWADYLSMKPSFPPVALTDVEVADSEATSTSIGDPHLRSAKEVAGYQVAATDAPLGGVTDFVIDDEGWGIPDLVVHVDTLPDSQRAVVPTRWVTGVSWEDQRVLLNRRREHSVIAVSVTRLPR
jgi:sporulation protein YlmC with PRC-barrel domain